MDFAALSFARPAVLLLLAMPVLLALWEATRRGTRVALPFDGRAAQQRTRGRRVLAGFITAANLLPALLLAAAVLLLAGPRREVQGPRAKKLTNVQFCLDISGSMLAGFGDGNRFDAAMAAIGDFTKGKPDAAFGLTVFGNDVLHWVPLTRDADAVRRAPPFVSPRSMPRQFYGTSVGNALLQCRDLLARSEEGDRMILLVSDGISYDINAERGEQVAQQMREENVRVYPIHVGDGGPPAALETIAAITGGEVFAAGDPAGLTAVFAELDKMRSAELEPPGKAYDDRFGPVAVVALAAAGLHALALAGVRYTPW